MAENVITVLFKVESEAFQAATELKNAREEDGCVISQVALVKKQNGKVTPCDGFDSGAVTSDDTINGLLIGSVVGILGGPIGMLLGGSYGALIGSALDASDALDSASIIEQVCSKLEDGDIALIALVQEDNEEIFNSKLSKFDTMIIRHDAAVVAVEVEEAVKVEKELEREAKRQLKAQKKEERAQKIEEKRSEVKANFEALKNKVKS